MGKKDKKTFKDLNPKTQKILRGSLILFFITLISFIYLLSQIHISPDLVWVLTFLYGILYALAFYVCIQIAYKLKNLKTGIIIFIALLFILFTYLITLL